MIPCVPNLLPWLKLRVLARNRKLLFWALFLSALHGCADDKSGLIAEKVRERVDDFRKKKTAECRQSLLSKAEKQVDSLLLLEAKEALQDSLSRLKPFRPQQPPAVLPIDSLKVKPIFDGDSNR